MSALAPPATVGVREVSKDYEGRRRRGAVTALRDVSFELEDGQFASIVGPSGCGKSTLLKMLLGVARPSGGELWVGGERVAGPRRDCSMMFQAPRLLPWRTVLRNVVLPGELLGIDRGERERRARELLEMVGLAAFADHYPHELSGGMQQRAAICRALITGPRLLLLDEPFGALDSITREQMNDELLRIWRETGCTVLLVTHDIDEAVYLSNRVLVMSDRPGRIVASLDVELPGERSYEVRRTAAFDGYATEIRQALGLAKGGADG